MAQIDTIETYSREELDALLYKAIKTTTPKGKRDRAIFLTAYLYMLRASEVGLLRRSDVDTKSHRLRIHRLKRGIGGEFELHPKVARTIKAYLATRDDDSPTLFLSRNARFVYSRRCPGVKPSASCVGAGRTRVGRLLVRLSGMAWGRVCGGS